MLSFYALLVLVGKYWNQTYGGSWTTSTAHKYLQDLPTLSIFCFWMISLCNNINGQHTEERCSSPHTCENVCVCIYILYYIICMWEFNILPALLGWVRRVVIWRKLEDTYVIILVWIGGGKSISNMGVGADAEDVTNACEWSRKRRSKRRRVMPKTQGHISYSMECISN